MVSSLRMYLIFEIVLILPNQCADRDKKKISCLLTMLYGCQGWAVRFWPCEECLSNLLNIDVFITSTITILVDMQYLM